MNDIAEAFAAPLPIKIDGVDYHFGDIDVNGFSEVRTAIQGQRIAAGREALAIIPPELQAAATAELMRQAMNPPGGLESQIQEYLTSKAGLAHCSWLSLRARHPELKTPDQAWEKAKSLGTMLLFSILIDRLKINAAKKSSGKPAADPTTPPTTPTNSATGAA